MKWPLALLFVSATAFAGEDADQMRARAHMFEQRGEWDEASAEYVKLEAFSKPEALYGEAFAAFEQNDNATASTLAGRVAQMTSPYKDRASLLHGDALFRSEDFAHAKSIYLAVRNTAKGDVHAVAENKVRACNRKLALPDGQDL